MDTFIINIYIHKWTEVHVPSSAFYLIASFWSLERDSVIVLLFQLNN